MNFFSLYALTVPFLAVLDAVWIGGLARTYYKTQLGALLSPQVLWVPAIALYFLYAAGIVFFVLQPALAAHSLTRAVLGGMFFGLVAFGVYDLTNLATTANWPVVMSFVDMAWGAFQGAVVSGAVYWIAIRFLGA